MTLTDLITFEQVLPGNRRLAANASADLANEVRALLGKLLELDVAGPSLADGRSVLFGWSRLVIRQSSGTPVLFVHEPDFLADPERETVPHVNRTVRVVRDQAMMIALTGAVPRDVFYNQIVQCEHRALEKSECYFERRAPITTRDSGWLAGCASMNETKTLEAADFTPIPVYSLLVDFPEALKLLALPAGYMGIFHFRKLVELFGPEGVSVPLPDGCLCKGNPSGI